MLLSAQFALVKKESVMMAVVLETVMINGTVVP